MSGLKAYERFTWRARRDATLPGPSSMRIGLVIERFDPQRGGVEQWTWQFARWMLAAGHEAHVFARSFAPEAVGVGIVPHLVPPCQSRVAFAAAVIHTPELLFLDEPFESIDPAGVASIKQWLHGIVAQGRTVFLTTHVLETVERTCSQVAIITPPGKLVWQGDITALDRGGSLAHDGREFRTLEQLFLHLTGERYAQLDWL